MSSGSSDPASGRGTSSVGSVAARRARSSASASTARFCAVVIVSSVADPRTWGIRIVIVGFNTATAVDHPGTRDRVATG